VNIFMKVDLKLSKVNRKTSYIINALLIIQVRFN
jgi:hypothetical protein